MKQGWPDIDAPFGQGRGLYAADYAEISRQTVACDKGCGVILSEKHVVSRTGLQANFASACKAAQCM